MSNFLIFLFASVLFFAGSCSKNKGVSSIDMELYELAGITSGYTWFENSSTFLDRSSGSGHAYPKLRTRFNSVASQMLDSNGRIVANAHFQDGSVIVKELFDGSNNLSRYAVLKKDSDNEFADSEGWVWGYIDSDGTVAETAENRGQACIACHQQAGNIDYILMNKFFP